MNASKRYDAYLSTSVVDWIVGQSSSKSRLPSSITVSKENEIRTKDVYQSLQRGGSKSTRVLPF